MDIESDYSTLDPDLTGKLLKNDYKADLKYYSPMFVRSYLKMKKKLNYYYGPYTEVKQTRV